MHVFIRAMMIFKFFSLFKSLSKLTMTLMVAAKVRKKDSNNLYIKVTVTLMVAA